MMDRHLDFEFEVGENERHNVTFAFDQLWGPLTISVDGQRVVRKLGMFSLRRTSRYEFSVGSDERTRCASRRPARRSSAASSPRSAWPMSTGGKRRVTPTPPDGGVGESRHEAAPAVGAPGLGVPSRSAPGPDRPSLLEEGADALAGVG